MTFSVGQRVSTPYGVGTIAEWCADYTSHLYGLYRVWMADPSGDYSVYLAGAVMADAPDLAPNGVVVGPDQAHASPTPLFPEGATRRFGLLPDNHPDRKLADPFNGAFAFFPDALAEMARISTTAGLKYNNGKTQWLTNLGGDRHTSMGRHLLDIAKMRGKRGEPGWADAHGEEAVKAYAALAWDVLAPLQELIERLNAKQGESK